MMSQQAEPSQNLKTFINGGLLVSVVVMVASFYVRFNDPYPPIWTAFAMPVAMALLGLRSLLLTPDARPGPRTQRAVGGLLVALSAVLLILSLVELRMAERARAADFQTNPTTDPQGAN